MQENERCYQKTVSAIGGALLIFLALVNLFGFSTSFLSILLSFFPLGDAALTVTAELLNGAGYLLAFMLPVLFLKLFLKGGKCKPRPMALSPKLSPELPLFIFAGMSVCFAASEINAALVQIFDYASFSSEVLWESGNTAEPYVIVLQFITVSIIPGICEELLFRGAILENLLPFGRSNAIFISAFLFAMMHQNSEQLLYTFVAGIALGLVYVYTGSIWNCTILHICNNFVSVLELSLIEQFGAGTNGTLAILLLEGAIYLLGTLSVAILLLRHAVKPRDLRDGIFGKDVPPSPAYAELPIPASRMRRLFFRPTMVIFLVACILQVLLLLGLAVML